MEPSKNIMPSTPILTGKDGSKTAMALSATTVGRSKSILAQPKTGLQQSKSVVLNLPDLGINLDEPAEPVKKKKKTKAEKRAEKKLKAEENRKQHRRDHLERELKNSEMNWKTIKDKFKDLIKSMKLPEMRDDAVTVWHVFDRAIDMKNCLMSRLLDFLNETEEQYRINEQAHVETIDDLITFCIKQLDEVKKNYMTQLTEEKTEEKDLEDGLQASSVVEVGQLKAILFAMEKLFQDFMTNFKSESMAKLDDDKNRFSELRESLRVELERQMANLWNHLSGVLMNYYKSTREMKEEYMNLKHEDIGLSQELHMQITRTQRLYENIKAAKEELAEIRERQSMLITDLTDEKQFYTDQLNLLRKKLKSERQHDKKQLTTLTVESNVTEKWLQNTVEKGEKILKLAAVCRKLETRKEKVIPFPNLPIMSTLEEDPDDQRRDSDTLSQVHNDFQGMNYFWLKVGNADAKRMEMVQCYDMLLLENQYLYNSLRRYIDGLKPEEPPTNIRKVAMDDLKIVRDKCVEKF